MRVIWKYPLEAETNQKLQMPPYTKILCVQLQGAMPCLWVEVETGDQPYAIRSIWTFGTGHEMPPNIELKYIGTYQMLGGALMFHVYEEVG